MCGRARADWDHFFNTVLECERRANAGAQVLEDLQGMLHAGPAHALGNVRKKLHERDTKLGLLDLLETFSYTLATRERDKLFALVGLANDSHKEDFAPDYDSFDERYCPALRQGFRRGPAAYEPPLPGWAHHVIPVLLVDTSLHVVGRGILADHLHLGHGRGHGAVPGRSSNTTPATGSPSDIPLFWASPAFPPTGSTASALSGP